MFLIMRELPWKKLSHDQYLLASKSIMEPFRCQQHGLAIFTIA